MAVNFAFLSLSSTAVIFAFLSLSSMAVNFDGLMFWSDWGDEPMIERANMDGSGRQIISSKKLVYPNGLAIDYDHSRLYFVDGGIHTLESMNFDGSSRQIIIIHYQRPDT
ncbi:low-density lipoprotein receptor-related protein 8-like [Drosophila bipectinata]|uniref:low-density lipoprotein receptor-related protein 8-like n=1 Tax=Drosophila bipectinata TaxID=42026 RepID=UPI0038B3217F